MQESWREDEDKLTFIVLSAKDIEDGHNEIDAMIGDVNLFLNDPEDDCCGEVNILPSESWKTTIVELFSYIFGLFLMSFQWVLFYYT